MCGIVGYVGPRDATPILMDGLARLEYRGYDSAGVAVLDAHGDIAVCKRAGKLTNLTAALEDAPLAGSPGLAHTRWATHGAPTSRNAHPHLDGAQSVAVVHNGIIENYLELRVALQGAGHVFISETDSEILAHLLQDGMARGLSLTEAMRMMLPRLRGAYAIVAMARNEPDVLVGTRCDVPLIVGLGEGENFFASDITALLRQTRRMLTLDDGEIATITPASVTIQTLGGAPVFRPSITVDWDAQMAEKDGYAHYLLKEMMEQPSAVRRAMMERITATVGDILTPTLQEFDEWAQQGGLERITRVTLLACGTSYYAALAARTMIERWARLPVEAAIASEFRYSEPVIGPDTLVIAITQSGETADTIAAVRLARDAGAPVVGITNAVGSALTREVDVTLYMQAGPEISVPATKTFVAATTVLTLLSLSLARWRSGLDPFAISQLLHQLETLPVLMEETLAIAAHPDSAVHTVARWLAQRQSAMFIGRGVGFVSASEGALKLKEVSYIHAESYPAGELKHGPIALLDAETPLLAVALQSPTYEKVVSNIQEVRARNARIIAVATQGDDAIRIHADDVFYVPPIDELLSPALAVIPLQLLAYYTAIERGCDIDQPRNLAKSVTVE